MLALCRLWLACVSPADSMACMQLIYSSTCATYGNPESLPVTEDTPAVPINPYGRAKLMAEGAIRDAAAADPGLRAVIFRYFNVYGSDPGGALGEFPSPALRRHSRISGACMDAAMHEVSSLKITGALRCALACAADVLACGWICLTCCSSGRSRGLPPGIRVQSAGTHVHLIRLRMQWKAEALRWPWGSPLGQSAPRN